MPNEFQGTPSSLPMGDIGGTKQAKPSTFKGRLVEEKIQLDDKLRKLNEFQKSEGFSKISPVQMTLLNIQAHAMATYSQCLLERLAWLEEVTA